MPKKSFTHEAELKYKSYKNKLISILRFAEKAYYSIMLEKPKNVKGIWKNVNTEVNKQFNPLTYPTYFVGNDIEICKKQDIANGFNNFFTNVGPSLAKQITLPKKDVSIFDYLEKERHKSPIDDQDIIRTVKNFKSKMSTHCNDLNMSMVKNIIAHIVKPLKHICNVSFNIGIFFNQMKIAKVIPIFKSGEKGVFTSYRPISFCPNSKKSWRNYTVTCYIVFYINIIYSALVNTDLDQTCQHHMP